MESLKISAFYQMLLGGWNYEDCYTYAEDKKYTYILVAKPERKDRGGKYRLSVWSFPGTPRRQI